MATKRKVEVSPDEFELHLIFKMKSPADAKNRVSVDEVRDYVMGELEDAEFWPPRQRDADGEPYVVDYATFPTS